MPRRDEYGYDDDDRDRDRYEGYDDYDRDDYDDRPRRSGRESASQRVSLPAIFLMIVGGLGFLTFGLAVVGAIIGPQGPNPFINPQQANDPAVKQGEQIGRIVGPIIRAIWSIIVVLGGMRLKALRNRGFVMFSCIFAMLPCNCECFIFAIPFAIWALVVISNEEVKRAFT
jgi:hypothetical protein